MRYNEFRWYSTRHGDKRPNLFLVSLSPCLLVSLALSFTFGSPHCFAQEKEGSEVTVSATASKIDAAGKQTVTVTFVMQKDWHIYANPVKNKSLTTAETRVEIKAKVKLAEVKIVYPTGKVHEDKEEGDYMIYEDKADVQITIQRAEGDSSPLEVEYAFNACNDVLMTCLLPKKAKIIIP